jgi:hypothetical protein
MQRRTTVNYGCVVDQLSRMLHEKVETCTRREASYHRKFADGQSLTCYNRSGESMEIVAGVWVSVSGLHADGEKRRNRGQATAKVAIIAKWAADRLPLDIDRCGMVAAETRLIPRQARVNLNIARLR